MTISERMRRRLATAGRNQRQATAHRDELVRAALAEGATLREVADAVGLTHTAIRRIRDR